MTPGAPILKFEGRPLMPGERKDRCANCKFALFARQNLVLCRRFPPVFQMLAMPQQPRPGVLLKPGQPAPITFTNASTYPQIQPDDWCGEYQPNPAANGSPVGS